MRCLKILCSNVLDTATFRDLLSSVQVEREGLPWEEDGFRDISLRIALLFSRADLQLRNVDLSRWLRCWLPVALSCLREPHWVTNLVFPHRSWAVQPDRLLASSFLLPAVQVKYQLTQSDASC